MLVKRASDKRTKMVRVHLDEVARVVRVIEKESRMVGEGQWRVSVSWVQSCIWGRGRVLEMDSGDGCPTMWMILSTAELYTLKWLIIHFCYVYFTTDKSRQKSRSWPTTHVMRFWVLFNSCGDCLHVFSKAFNLNSGCKSQSAFCGSSFRCQFSFQNPWSTIWIWPVWGCAMWDQGWFGNSSEGATFPRTSLSTISLEFSSLALSVLWLESSCSAVYFLGLCSPPRRSGWADREKAKGASPPSLDRSSPSSGGWLPSQEFRCLLVPVATVAPFITGLLGFEAGMKKTAKRKKNREFSPLSWASTVFLLAPWPQGFSWRVLCPALRTTHGFQVSRSSGLGTEEGKWQSQAISAVLRILVSFLSVSATICFAESSNSWCLHSMQVWQPPPYGWLWPWHLTKGSVRSPRIPVCGTHLFCGCTLFTYYVSQTIRAREAAHL